MVVVSLRWTVAGRRKQTTRLRQAAGTFGFLPSLGTEYIYRVKGIGFLGLLPELVVGCAFLHSTMSSVNGPFPESGSLSFMSNQQKNKKMLHSFHYFRRKKFRFVLDMSSGHKVSRNEYLYRYDNEITTEYVRRQSNRLPQTSKNEIVMLLWQHTNCGYVRNRFHLCWPPVTHTSTKTTQYIYTYNCRRCTQLSSVHTHTHTLPTREHRNRK
jgi:hypothetical protein